jgi:hypothetical protein
MRPLISLKGAYLIDVVAGGAYSSILLVKKKNKKTKTYSWQKWEFCWQSQSGGRAQDKKSEVKHCGFGSEDCTEMSSFISICRQMDAI